MTHMDLNLTKFAINEAPTKIYSNPPYPKP